MNNDYLLFFIFLGLAAFFVLRSWLDRKKLENLIPLLNGTIKTQWGRPLLQGIWEGKTAEIFLKPGGRNTPPKLQISLQHYLNFKLTVYTDNLLYQLAKKTGMMKEVELGDHKFDQTYFLASDHPQEVIAFLTAPKRETVGNLRFSMLELGPQGIRLTINYYNDGDLQPQQMMNTLQKLNSLTQ